ncbi:hypothetical protein [Sinomonas atrocyanea]|uniref:hypothetical protein n=1 Tax=Sinomonas atrocyanea TaxID=37927 RepID=UPI002781AA8F|nr:hypothetical protein [Sinomonas atrocyanea]MDQ0259481.1 hypothetical protein [Sinomonas atrocyanea]MDR6623526.1 hypothetical protein [Sinomonas atrocyanea]
MNLSAKELAEALRHALTSENVPVPLKALIAAVLAAAKGKAPTRLGMATIGRFSHGSSQTHYGALLDALVERIPAEVSAMVPGDIDPTAAARLRQELQKRDETISELRRDLSETLDRHASLQRYALALHHQVREQEQRDATESGASVRTLHAVDAWE